MRSQHQVHMSAYNAAMDKDIPVIYTAVTDPVSAELADKDGEASRKYQPEPLTNFR